MQPVSLFDEIEVAINDSDIIEVIADHPDVPNGTGNLAHRAAMLLLAKTGISCGVEIEIRKRVPHGAGLGGGSSNAATVLMALNKLLNSGLSLKELMLLGGELGSDVPFFMLKSSAVATGVGTELKPVDMPGYQYVLINPGFSVSTEWAYTNFHLTNSVENNNLFNSYGSLNDLSLLTRSMVNDLESVTAQRYPQIGKIKDALQGLGADAVLMSGSGPTVFGIFSEEESAARAAVSLRASLSSKNKIFHVHGL